MRYFLFIFFLSFSIFSFSKNRIKIIVLGSGATIEDAKENALRSALEQVSGVYFSAYTEIINNQIIRDEMKSVTNGNILKYSILSKTKIADRYVLTIKATISPNGFADFIRAKTNSTIIVDGDIYVANMKQKELDKKAEYLAIETLMEICKQEIRKYYKYNVNSSSPQTNSYGGDKIISMDVHISFRLKRKYKRFRKYIISNIKGFSLKKREIAEYEQLTGERVYENKEKRSQFGVGLLELILDSDLDDTYPIYTRNPIKFPSDQVFNFNLTDGVNEWTWDGELSWKCPSHNIAYSKEIIGDLENNEDGLLKWPLPSVGEKNKITLTLEYSTQEFQNVKFLNLNLN
jgi:hypothetical protein